MLAVVVVRVGGNTCVLTAAAVFEMCECYVGGDHVAGHLAVILNGAPRQFGLIVYIREEIGPHEADLACALSTCSK